MKINDSTYECDWCPTTINKVVKRVRSTGNSKHSVPDQLVCTKCFRFVSQKTKLEIEEKFKRPNFNHYG